MIEKLYISENTVYREADVNSALNELLSSDADGGACARCLRQPGRGALHGRIGVDADDDLDYLEHPWLHPVLAMGTGRPLARPPDAVGAGRRADPG